MTTTTPPLTPQDIANQLDKYQPLIKSLSRKWYVPGYDPEDIYQECQIAAIRAIQTHDPIRGASLATHISHVITNRMANMVRDSHRLCRQVDRDAMSLYETIDTEDGTSDYLIDTIVDPTMHTEAQAIDNVSVDEALSATIAELGPKYEDVFCLFAEGYTQQRIAATLGLSQQTVSDRIRKTRTTLRRHYLTGD